MFSKMVQSLQTKLQSKTLAQRINFLPIGKGLIGERKPRPPCVGQIRPLTMSLLPSLFKADKHSIL